MTCRRSAEREASSDATVTTDCHVGKNKTSLGACTHEAIFQTKAEKRETNAAQACHWTISLLKRWLLGTHACGVQPKYLKAFLDEFDVRPNRRNSFDIARIADCVIASVAAKPPLTMKTRIRMTKLHRRFASTQAEPA